MCGGGGSNEVPETEAEKQLAKISIGEWNRYVTAYKPVEEKFINTVKATGGDYSNMEGKASMANEAAFDKANNAEAKTLQQHGVNPNSGAGLTAVTDTAAHQADSGASGVTSADVAVKNRENQGLLSAVQMGRGQAVNAVTGFGDIASNSVRTAENNAAMDAQNHAATMETAGLATGAGLRYLKPSTTPTIPSSSWDMAGRGANTLVNPASTGLKPVSIFNP